MTHLMTKAWLAGAAAAALALAGCGGGGEDAAREDAPAPAGETQPAGDLAEAAGAAMDDAGQAADETAGSGEAEAEKTVASLDPTSPDYEAPKESPFAETSAPAVQAADGETYLALNAERPGVIVRPSGLQIEQIENGAADGVSPQWGQYVQVQYRGQFIDGTVFDSSYARSEPATFPVGGLIQGWNEALMIMKPGDKWKLAIPYNLAYGESGRGPIGPRETLLFDIELLDVLDEFEPQVPPQPKAE